MKTDPITKSVCAKFKHRARIGKKKYGVTLHDAPLTEKQVLVHLQEELQDAVVYLEKIIQNKT